MTKFSLTRFCNEEKNGLFSSSSLVDSSPSPSSVAPESTENYGENKI